MDDMNERQDSLEKMIERLSHQSRALTAAAKARERYTGGSRMTVKATTEFKVGDVVYVEWEHGNFTGKVLRFLFEKGVIMVVIQSGTLELKLSGADIDVLNVTSGEGQ